MDRYHTLNHEKFIIRYHIIFSTKYRKRCLYMIKDDVVSSMRRAESMQDKWKIEVMETDYDHIHFMISATPSCRVCDIIRSLKQVSTSDVWMKHNDYMKSFYWSGKHHLWTRGYFCSSIGVVSDKTLKHYIENQG